MKSVHALFTIITIVLTGEKVSEFLATNAGVLAAIIATAFFWRYMLTNKKSKKSNFDAK